jgi:hypothetical protein
MQKSPSWQADSRSGSQEIPSPLRNPKIHYRIHYSPPLVPILNHMSPVHTLLLYLTSVLILSYHIHLGLSSGLLPSGFLVKTVYGFLISSMCCMPWPYHYSWFHHPNIILAGHSGRAVWGVCLGRLVAGIVGSNPAQGMDVCPRLSVFCCPV